MADTDYDKMLHQVLEDAELVLGTKFAAGFDLSSVSLQVRLTDEGTAYSDVRIEWTEGGDIDVTEIPVANDDPQEFIIE